MSEEYVYLSEADAVTQKTWAAGSSQLISTTQPLMSPDGTVYIEDIKYPPSWDKLVDEVVVNALDHIVRCEERKWSRVTYISVDYDSATGQIIVENDGQALPIEIHKEATLKLKRPKDKPVWLPSMLFGMLHQGGNHVKGARDIIGGTNGLGAKIANIFSNEFEVFIRNTSAKREFVQKWTRLAKNTKSKAGNKSGSNGHEIVVTEGDPQVSVITVGRRVADKKDITRLTFTPYYSEHYPKFDFSSSGVVDLIRMRMFYAAAYAGTFASRPTVRFNGVDMTVKKPIEAMAEKLFAGANYVTGWCRFEKPPGSKSSLEGYDWQYCVTDSRGKIDAFSIVNGVVVPQGSHIRRLHTLIAKKLEGKFGGTGKQEMKISPKAITDQLRVILIAKIPNPQWGGQRKDNLTTDIRKFAMHGIDSAVEGMVKFIKDRVMYLAMQENRKDMAKTLNKEGKKLIPTDKYTKARKLGKCGPDEKCFLLIVEGDSAMSQVKKGVPNTDYFGILSLGGVIMNARKQSRDLDALNTDIDQDEHSILVLDSLQRNEKLTQMLSALGLDYNKKYKPGTATYAKEIGSLKYAGLVACVDQDLDGKGNILGLVLSLFDRFWPALLEAGYVKWFATPLMRAYPNNTTRGVVNNFYTDAQFDEWSEKLGETGMKKYTIKYYKGLGSHNDDEVADMFSDFLQKLYTYTVDDKRATRRMFNVYFGDDPDLRKVELSLPTRQVSKEEIQRQTELREITCVEHLTFETNCYQKDNLERKLNHVIDGQNQVGRKIIAGFIKAFHNGNVEIKVSQLGGIISKHFDYHHGEESLVKSIRGRGFVACGGVQLPFIVPGSNFGTRARGGADAAQARYIKCTLNKKLVDLLLPPEDYYLLDFNFEDNQRIEPKYFVPTLPLAVLENANLPAHGWKFDVRARDVFQVIKYLQLRIQGDFRLDYLFDHPHLYDKLQDHQWTGKLVSTANASMTTEGCWEYTSNPHVVRVTELPLGLWTATYTRMIEANILNNPKSKFAKIYDGSGKNNKISIEITLREPADSYTEEEMVKVLKLRKTNWPELHFIGKNHEVLHFNNYHSVIEEWYAERKQMYWLRQERQILGLQYKIVMLREQYRYLTDFRKLKIGGGMRLAQMEEILENNKYLRIRHTLVKDAGFVKNDALLEAIFGRGAKFHIKPYEATSHATLDIDGTIHRYETSDKKYKMWVEPGSRTENVTFDYLLDLKDRHKSTEHMATIADAIRKLEEELDSLLNIKEPFPGATQWLNTLDELNKVIKSGMETKWKYSVHKPRFMSR